MSELINARDNRATIRWKLLTSASALALTAYVSCGSVARAEDTDRPTIWIELGGQMESVTGEGARLLPRSCQYTPIHPSYTHRHPSKYRNHRSALAKMARFQSSRKARTGSSQQLPASADRAMTSMSIIKRIRNATNITLKFRVLTVF